MQGGAPFVYPRELETQGLYFMQPGLSFEELGFEEIDENIFSVYFEVIVFGDLDVTELRFRSVRALPSV